MISKNFLICLTGLPASGKTTFAKIIKRIIEERNGGHKVVIIDPDKIRDSISPGDFDYSKEQLVRNENIKEIRSALENDVIVISDDLNYYTSMRHDLKTITDSLKINFYIIHIATPIEICLKWNEKRGFTIPNEVIEDISRKFDNFDNYSWDYPLIKIDISKINDVKAKAETVLDIIIRDIEGEKEQKERSNEIPDQIRIYKERLDKITRNFVSSLLQNPEYSSMKEEIIKNRKIFIKAHSNIILNDSEINGFFIEHLEKALNLKIL